MTIVALTKPPVKPTRNTTRKPAPFGAGILPTRKAAPVSDRQWAAQIHGEQSDRYDTIELTTPARRPDPRHCPCYRCVMARTARYDSTAEDRAIDLRANVAAIQDRLDRGMIGHELAAYIERTSLVGHPA